MKRVRMSGLCLVAVFAMSAVPAFAAGCPNGACAQAAATLPAGALTEFTLPNSSTNEGGGLIGSQPGGITAGPDGNLWFTEEHAHQIGRITPSGSITEFPLPPSPGLPLDIIAGPDGNLWFLGGVRPGAVGRITPNGTVSEIPTTGKFSSITAGPDGNIWGGGPNGIARMAPSGAVSEFPLQAGYVPFQITAGPDGNLWFTEQNTSKIGRVTPSGSITEFPIPTPEGKPEAITAGSDGNIWVYEVVSYRNVKTRVVGPPPRIARVTPSGAITEFPIPPPEGGLISFGRGTAGPDGNVWFSGAAGKVIRVTPSGTISEFQLASSSDLPDITAGPDGNLWFTELQLNKIGRLNPRLLPSASAAKCVVPKLKGKTLAQAKKLLGRAHCKLGKVTKPATHKHTLVVVSQKPAAKKSLPSGAKVSLRLG